MPVPVVSGPGKVIKIRLKHFSAVLTGNNKNCTPNIVGMFRVQNGVIRARWKGQQLSSWRPKLWYQMMEQLLGALTTCASFNGSWAWWNLEALNRRSGWNSSWCGSHGNARLEACKEVDGEVDGESLQEGWPNLQERELLASKRRNSMWNLRQCAENLAAYHYSKSSLQWRFLNLLFIEEEKASSFSSKLR